MAEKLIRLYQILGSIRHRIIYTAFGFSSECKHSPTCSRYAAQQIREHGTIVGSVKGLIRILTCW